MSLSQCGPSCGCASVVSVLLPHLSGVVAERAWEVAGRVLVRVRASAAQAACPRCGALSGRVHSGYLRRLRDAAAGGREVVIWLAVRRLFCLSPDCGAVTFTEQPGGLATRYARRTPPARAVLTAVAVALCGRAGARLAGELGVPAGRDSMIRLVMAVPVPELANSPEILGVDDFALRKGRDYATVLIDMATGKVAGLLPDREAATFRAWLEAHPGAAVICRDRGGAYAEGARDGAPDAVQVADRWHLWHNLCEHAGKEAARHAGCLEDPDPDPGPDPGPEPAAAGPPEAGEAGLAARTRLRYELVQALRAEGKGIMAVMKETGWAKDTVRRYARAASADELMTAPPPRPSLLGGHGAYLRQRWDQGCTSARTLHAEVTARGYTGSYGTVSTFLRPLRKPRPAPPSGPRPRDVARWLLSRPGSLTRKEQAGLAQAMERCPHLNTLHGHVRGFARLMQDRAGAAGLDDWLAAAEASSLPSLLSFAHGIRIDHAAVLAGLSLPWSSGKVEGTVNKLKLLKRQTYGHASLALLQQRLILT
ncbi:MAG TPA: ISL3 family transposase [Thermoanaerobaculia bacterium]|nr:ISL3 family transposase [Thermoanaerobaculia bacterium]